jgi:phenylacetic acid degradation operon negative regulatory protein
MDVDLDAQEAPAGEDPGPGVALRPQSLMLTFLGTYILDRDLSVYSGSVIDVFARVGIGEHAARSTLSRMVNRGLLQRTKHGRKMYFGLTERSARILRDGAERIWRVGAVNRDWDGTWTMVAFSLPEAWQRQRHDLRSRLAWAGFGPLLGGLWIAPGPVDVTAAVAELGLEDHVKVFHATAAPALDAARMVRETWDLAALADRYRGFAERWRLDEAAPPPHDPLRVKLLLFTEWLQLVRGDPRLPLDLLPADWPAGHAQEVFRGVNAIVDEPAAAMVADLLDTVPAEPGG